MAKVQEIGPYSAYAIAVKYGYKGTEEEWVKEQEENREAAEAAAAAAAQSAKNAAASASGVAQSGQQAVQSIKDAQTAAEQAIDTAKQQAVQAAQAEAEKAATSAGQAASSAAEAAQSATSAAAEVGKVQSAGTSAVQAVQQAQSTATEAVSDAQQTATQAVSQAQTAAVSAVQTEGTTQTSAVASAASSALTNISGAKDAALSDVAEAGAAQVSAIGTTGADAVEDVNDAKTAALEEIDAANAALPAPTQSDAGKVPTVKADGSAYELAGPYAPLSAAIRPTASGNPVNIADSVEWPLLGLKVYGKSTQDGTPSPESPVPIVSAGGGGSIALTISDGADQSQQLTISTPAGLPGIPVTSGGNYTDSTGQQLICDVIDFKSGLFYSNVIYFDLSDYADSTWYTWGVSNGAEGLTGFFVYISDETKKDIDYKIISNILPFSGNAFGGAEFGINIGNVNTANPYLICTVQNTDLSDVSSNDAAVQSFKDFLKGKQCYALSARHAAVTSPIPPEELAAYRALHTYDGTTVVSTAEPVAGIEAQYVADGTKIIENLEKKISDAVTAAITLAGGNK